MLAAALAAVAALAAACNQGPPAKHASTHHAAAPVGAHRVARPVGPHGGVNLNVLVVTDGTPPVEAIRQQLTSEGVPATVVRLRDSSRPAITGAFLSRTLPDGTRGGNFDGIVLPGAVTSGLSGPEMTALATYESTFGVRQVDAYSPPMPMSG